MALTTTFIAGVTDDADNLDPIPADSDGYLRLALVEFGSNS